MLISDSHKFIYVHVSRTGGSSTKEALDRFSRLNILGGRLSPAKLDALWDNWRVGAHTRPRILRKFISENKWKTYFKFVFVRNPYSWAVSRWAYNRRKNSTAIEFIKAANSDARESFYSWLKSFNTSYYIPHVEESIIEPGGWMSSYVFSRAGKKEVDFVGRFENLIPDFYKVCKRLSLNVQFPHINGLPWKKHYSMYYNDAARALATEMFALDLTKLNYTFEKK